MKLFRFIDFHYYWINYVSVHQSFLPRFIAARVRVHGGMKLRTTEGVVGPERADGKSMKNCC